MGGLRVRRLALRWTLLRARMLGDEGLDNLQDGDHLKALAREKKLKQPGEGPDNLKRTI